MFNLLINMLILARIGLSLGTLFYAIWIVSELKHREEISKVVMQGSGGDDNVTDFRFGWKLALGFFLGLPVLAILWGLVI